MNLRFKTDPSITLLVDLEGWNEKERSAEVGLSIIDSYSNISTGGNLELVQTWPTLTLTLNMIRAR